MSVKAASCLPCQRCLAWPSTPPGASHLGEIWRVSRKCSRDGCCHLLPLPGYQVLLARRLGFPLRVAHVRFVFRVCLVILVSLHLASPMAAISRISCDLQQVLEDQGMERCPGMPAGGVNRIRRTCTTNRILTCAHLHVCVYVSARMCMYTYMYIYIYTHNQYIYIYIYIYTHTCTALLMGLLLSKLMSKSTLKAYDAL